MYLTPAEVRELLGLSKGVVCYHTLLGHLRVLTITPTLQRYVASGLRKPAGRMPTAGVLGTAQCADLLRISQRTVLACARAGTLPMTMRGGAWGIHASRLQEWADAHTDGEHDAELLKRRRFYFLADLGDLSKAQQVTKGAP